MVLGEVFSNISSNILFDIGLIIIIATVAAYLLKVIKQPLIPAYIIAGILIGPFGLNLVKNYENIKILAELGIAFLLFMVGLELNGKKIKEVGSVSIFAALLETALLFLVGFIIAGLFGFTSLESIYLGLILAFSSTLIVVKLLVDRKELGTLHGKIILGTLLLQDIVAIIALSFLANKGFSIILILSSLIKVLGLFVLALLLSKFILPRLFKFSAKTEELLFISSLALLFIFASISSLIGFSIVIGAFVAGLALGNLPYNFDIAGNIRPLRDFFITIFFVTLGVGLTFSNFNKILYPLITILLVLLIAKPVIIAFFTSLFGYKERTSLVTGLLLFQVSEFSLILISQGLLLNHISRDFFSLIILVTVISMALTPYVVNNENKIYSKLRKTFMFLDRLPNHRERLEYNPSNSKKEIIILGCNRMGSILVKHLQKIKSKLLIIDHDPGVIKSLIDKKYPCIYGDVTNKEVLEQIRFKDAKIVISTIPEIEHNLFLIKHVKRINKNILVFITADYKTHASILYQTGADYVILPKFISGEFIKNILKNKSRIKSWIKSSRNKHIDYLDKIEILGEVHHLK